MKIRSFTPFGFPPRCKATVHRVIFYLFSLDFFGGILSNCAVLNSCRIFFQFIDLDECQSPDACGDNHTCNNTVGSYRCECPIGFIADSGAQDTLNPVCIGKKWRTSVNCRIL